MTEYRAHLWGISLVLWPYSHNESLLNGVFLPLEGDRRSMVTGVFVELPTQQQSLLIFTTILFVPGTLTIYHSFTRLL